jgi:hypothetical protein
MESAMFLSLVVALSLSQVNVQNEGVNKGNYGYLNFVGAAIDCGATNNGKVMTCTVDAGTSSGGGGGVDAGIVGVMVNASDYGPTATMTALPGLTVTLENNENVLWRCSGSMSASSSGIYFSAVPQGGAASFCYRGYGISSATSTNSTINQSVLNWNCTTVSSVDLFSVGSSTLNWQFQFDGLVRNISGSTKTFDLKVSESPNNSASLQAGFACHIIRGMGSSVP